MGIGDWFHHRRHPVLDLADVEQAAQRAARERIIELGHHGAPGSDRDPDHREGYGSHLPDWMINQRPADHHHLPKILTTRDMEVAAGDRPGEHPRPGWDGPTDQRKTIAPRSLNQKIRMLSGLPDNTHRYRPHGRFGQ